MTPNLDIYRTANLLVKHHGEDSRARLYIPIAPAILTIFFKKH